MMPELESIIPKISILVKKIKKKKKKNIQPCISILPLVSRKGISA